MDKKELEQLKKQLEESLALVNEALEEDDKEEAKETKGEMKARRKTI